MVPVVLEELRESHQVGMSLSKVSLVREHACLLGVQSGEERGPAGVADGVLAVGPVETYSSFGQPIDVGGMNQGMSIGPEVGVAATKTFSSQLVCLYLLTLSLAQVRNALSADATASHLEELSQLPQLIEKTLPVQVHHRGELQKGFLLDSIEITPPFVRVRGAKSQLAPIETVTTMVIDLSELSRSTEMIVQLDLPQHSLQILDEGVSSTPHR